MRTSPILSISIALMLMMSSDVAIAKYCGPRVYEGQCDEISCRDWCKILMAHNSKCVPKGCQCEACWARPPSSSSNSPLS
ncbi:hypothetical protein ACQJBY_056181 [Aegilops geniculata]